jgi:hypothetical protein
MSALTTSGDVWCSWEHEARMFRKLVYRKLREAAWTIFCWFLEEKKSFCQKKYYLLVSLKHMSWSGFENSDCIVPPCGFNWNSATFNSIRHACIFINISSNKFPSNPNYKNFPFDTLFLHFKQFFARHSTLFTKIPTNKCISNYCMYF